MGQGYGEVSYEKSENESDQPNGTEQTEQKYYIMLQGSGGHSLSTISQHAGCNITDSNQTDFTITVLNDEVRQRCDAARRLPQTAAWVERDCARSETA